MARSAAVFHNPQPAGSLPANAPPEAIKKEFAKRLQAAMTKAGLNQSELARAAARFMPKGRNLGRDAVSHYIRGLHLPGPVALNALAQALKTAHDELLPQRIARSVDTVAPEVDLRDAGNGMAWVRINQALPWEQALEILRILKGDDALAGR